MASGIDVDKWIEPGMVVEFEIEGIGVLRNSVVQEETPKIDYVSNGMKGHLEYTGNQFVKDIKFPWETGVWKTPSFLREKKKNDS